MIRLKYAILLSFSICSISSLCPHFSITTLFLDWVFCMISFCLLSLISYSLYQFWLSILLTDLLTKEEVQAVVKNKKHLFEQKDYNLRDRFR